MTPPVIKENRKSIGNNTMSKKKAPTIILSAPDVTLDMCKKSAFGCRNCLWNSVECSLGEKFVPAVAFNGKYATCTSYAYYD